MKTIPIKDLSFIHNHNTITEGKNLTGKFCAWPFDTIRVDRDGTVNTCCPQWMAKPIGNILESSIYQLLMSESAKDIKKSILDGSFRYCNHDECGYIRAHHVGERDFGLIDKQHHHLGWINPSGVETFKIIMDYEDSCNLRCPSCRDHLKMNVEPDELAQTIHTKVLQEIDWLIEHGKRVQVSCSGSADPFASPLFHEWLRTAQYDPAQFGLSLITNATLMTPAVFEYPIIRDCLTYFSTSLDAATKDTYEKVRLGGKWERVTRNLSRIEAFIDQADRPILWQIGFVISSENWRELPQMIELVNSFKHTTNATFVNMAKPHYMSDHEFEKFNIMSPSHPDHSEFVSVINNLPPMVSGKVVNKTAFYGL